MVIKKGNRLLLMFARQTGIRTVPPSHVRNIPEGHTLLPSALVANDNVVNTTKHVSRCVLI